MAQRLKRLPPMRETWVRSLGWEDPLEKEMAIHSSILAWRSHGRRSLVGYSPWGCKQSDTTEWLHLLCTVLIAIRTDLIRVTMGQENEEWLPWSTPRASQPRGQRSRAENVSCNYSVLHGTPRKLGAS